jgi:4-alpha-glucanotransferase
MAIPPFPPEYRASGLLLHFTSLPSPYGVGDVGPAAGKWIDKLSEAGQSWWQALPLGPTGYGDSPYQSLSSFAGNGLLISPDRLIEEGLLREAECRPPSFPSAAIDYGAVIRFKRRLLERVWANFQISAGSDLRAAFDEFCHRQAHWLEDYALFRVLKAKYGEAYYLEWPADLVRRDAAALARVKRELRSEIQQVCFAQFLLFRQGERLRDFGRSKGVSMIGDLPFYVSPDSSDVWANPELFLLDEHRRPTFVAGVPPDYFSSEGQLWGNPVYNWEVLRQSGYRWWIDRLRALLAFVDVVRLDHFRGFAAAWRVPAGAATAKTGEWVTGPGADFFNEIKKELGGLPFIAEDLGIITPDVSKLRDDFEIPARVSSNLLSTVTPTIRICPKTLFATRSYTPELTTTRQPGSGLRRFQKSTESTCGIISNRRNVRAQRFRRNYCASPGRPALRLQSPLYRICSISARRRG